MNVLKSSLVVMLGFTVLASGILTTELRAEFEEGILPALEIEGSATVDAYNKYVWRGFLLDNDSVVQPGVSLSGYGVTLSYWSSFDADSNDQLASAEVDFTIDYTKEFEYASISLGHTNYDFPAAATYSKEWYIGVGLSEVMLSPTLTYYRDYAKEENGGADGEYVNFGVSHSLTLIEDSPISLDLGASVGFNNKLFITGNGGNYLLTAGVTLPLTDNTTLSPSFGFSSPFGDLKKASDGNQKNRTYGGVSLSSSF